MEDQPEVFWAVIISMYLGNIVLLILNLPLIPYIAKLLTVPRYYLVPFVIFFSLIGAYIGQNNATELLIMIGLGCMATILRFGGSSSALDHWFYSGRNARRQSRASHAQGWWVGVYVGTPNDPRHSPPRSRASRLSNLGRQEKINQ